MSISIISDIHVKNNDDPSCKTLLKFLNNPIVQDSQEIFFLGDIFDFLVGNHQEYYQDFKNFFETLITINKKQIKLTYIEGNHDVHIKKLLTVFFKKHDLNLDLLNVIQGHHVRLINEKIVYLSHGDELLQNLHGYQFYKKLITTKLAKVLANYIVPYMPLTSLGKYASSKSRKRKSPTPQMLEEYKIRFRKIAMQIAQINKYNAMICGHTHILDHHTENDIEYFNCGFPPEHQKFIFVDQESNISLKDI